MQTIILSGLRSSQFCGEYTAVRSCRIMITEKEDVAGGICGRIVWHCFSWTLPQSGR